MEIKIKGINKIKNAWKNYNIVINQVELKNGDISGTFEGKLIMEQSKKISNQDIMNLLTKKFEDIDKKFEDMNKDMNKRFEDMNKRFEDMNKDMNKRFDKIDAKIDLMIKTPTMNSEIDHEALAKIDLS